ncbi:MAG: hypothetical protein ACKVRP_10495 [Bacteroidota bacterium]
MKKLRDFLGKANSLLLFLVLTLHRLASHITPQIPIRVLPKSMAVCAGQPILIEISALTALLPGAEIA